MRQMIDDPSPAELRAWYEEQLERNRRYRRLLAARAAGKSDVQFVIPAGSKRVLLPGDDIGTARTASKDLRHTAAPMTADMRRQIDEIHQFTERQAIDAKLADYAKFVEAAEQAAAHQLVRARPPIPGVFRETDIRKIKDSSEWKLDGKLVAEGARLVVIGINSPDMAGQVKRAKDTGTLWFISDSGEFLELRHLAPRPVRWESEKA